MQDAKLGTFDELMAAALAASGANDAEAAIDGFRQASAARPTAPLPQFMLGAEFAALGDMANAEAAFANATLLAPDFPLARYQLGLLQFSSGRAAIALLTWQPLLELAPSDPLPHFVKGFAALANDRFSEAVAHYTEGLKLNTANEALSGDIQKVIDGIHALGERQARLAALDASASSDHASDALDDAAAHILLANYQQQGRAH